MFRLEKLEHIHEEWTEGDKGCLRGGYCWRGGLARRRGAWPLGGRRTFLSANRREARRDVFYVDQQRQESPAHGASNFLLVSQKTSYAKSEGYAGCVGGLRSL